MRFEHVHPLKYGYDLKVIHVRCLKTDMQKVRFLVGVVDHCSCPYKGQSLGHFGQRPNGTLGLLYDPRHVLLQQCLEHLEAQPRCGYYLVFVPRLLPHLTR
ncbi:hypothetical protein D3C71_1394590 [compost metagenome]